MSYSCFVTIIAALFVLYIVYGSYIFFSSWYHAFLEHELAHARKAKEYHPELDMAVIVWCPMFLKRRKKYVVDDIMVFEISAKKGQRGEFQVSRFVPSDTFESFTDDEISQVANAGITSDEKCFTAGLLKSIRFLNLFSLAVILLWIAKFYALKLKSNVSQHSEMTWNDFDAVKFPKEFREHSINDDVHSYDSLMKLAESFF